MRLTGLWAVEHGGEAHVARDRSDVGLFGLLAAREFPWGSLTVGVARTFAGGHRNEGVDGGIGWMGHRAGDDWMHTDSFRYADPMEKRYDSGSLLAIGYSTEVGLRRDVLYASGYWTDGGLRRSASGTPSSLGLAGLSFSSAGIGDHRPDLRSGRLDSAGFAVGMRTFFADEAANWAVELGHRQHLDDARAGSGNRSGTALTTRARYRFAERFLVQLDAYYAIDGTDSKNRHQEVENGRHSSALRVELRVDF